MDPELLDKLDHVGRILRKSQRPFGGLQLVFVGDFFQLPPVRKEGRESVEFAGTKERSEFSFESQVWKEMKPEVILLDEIVRQSDPLFQKVLNEVRYGSLSKESLEILKSRQHQEETWQKLEIKPTLLFSRRAEVEMINQQNIRALSKKGAQIYKAHTDFTAVLQQGLDKTSDIVKRAETKLDLNAPYKAELELRIGAQVMLITNMDVENGLVNGSRGIIQEFSADLFPMVLFQGHANPIKIGEASWESEDVEGLKRVQIPLICAWAITIHKSQGATLDSALIDIGSRTFERGQAYVALSRVKSLESLYIWELDPLAFKAHPKVVAFYNQFV